MRNDNDWLARNQNNVSEWSDMSTRGQLFQWATTIEKNPAKRVDLVQNGHHHYLIEMYIVLVMIWLKNCLLGANQQSLDHIIVFYINIK